MLEAAVAMWKICPSFSWKLEFSRFSMQFMKISGQKLLRCITREILVYQEQGGTLQTSIIPNFDGKRHYIRTLKEHFYNFIFIFYSHLVIFSFFSPLKFPTRPTIITKSTWKRHFYVIFLFWKTILACLFSNSAS